MPRQSLNGAFMKLADGRGLWRVAVIGVAIAVGSHFGAGTETTANAGVPLTPHSSNAFEDSVNLIAHKVPNDGGTVFRDPEFGVSFQLPHGWTLDRSRRWLSYGWDGEAAPATTASMYLKGSNIPYRLFYRLFTNVPPQTPAEVDQILMANVARKVKERRTSDWLTNYRVRPDSYEVREIGGQRALAYVGDYTQYKKDMVEYLVSVQDSKSVAQFFVRAPADQLDEIRKDAEPIIESIRIP
jgi:hypothetical protein